MNNILFVSHNNFICRIHENASNIIIYNCLQRKSLQYIKQYNKSYCINNRRISKFVLNISHTIANEIIKLSKQQKNISDLSIYSIIYLLLTILKNRHKKYNNKILDIITDIYTFEDIYLYLCNFNILYTYKFPFKLCFIFTLFDSYYLNMKEIIYILETNNYFKNLYLSMKYISSSLYNIFIIRIIRYSRYIYTNLLIDNNINNPILYSCIMKKTTQNNYIDIINIQNRINKKLYYNILLYYLYINLINVIDQNEIHNYIQHELTNLILERIVLNDIYKIYFLRISNFNNFILYIISNNIIISEQLTEKLFYDDSYKFTIVDIELKLKFFIDNNVLIKTRYNFRKIPKNIYNRFIDHFIINWMTPPQFIRFLKSIKYLKIVLTNKNIIKLKQFNTELYMKILHK